MTGVLLSDTAMSNTWRQAPQINHEVKEQAPKQLHCFLYSPPLFVPNFD